jgi:replicative DNA helicase
MDIESTLIGTLYMAPSTINEIRYLLPEHLEDKRNIKLYTWFLNKGKEQPHRTRSYDITLISNETGISMSYIREVISMGSTVENIIGYAQTLHERYINDEMADFADELTEITEDESNSPHKTIELINKRVAELNAKLLLQEDPLTENPADELELMHSWRTTWGIDKLDEMTCLISNAMTLWVANSNSGKTMAAIQIAAHNAIDNKIPVDLYLAETPILEAKMGLLINRGAIKSWQGNEIMFNEEYRTKHWIKRIRSLWDDVVGDAPLRIHGINGWAMNDALSLISHGRKRLKIVDHAYAMVMQGGGELSRMQTFKEFGYLFSYLNTIAISGDNVVLVFNQLSNEQNTEKTWKNQTASFGGASGANIARTKLNLRRKEEMGHAGWIYLDAIFTKTKGSGILIKGVNRTYIRNPDNEEFQMYMDLDKRKITGVLSG